MNGIKFVLCEFVIAEYQPRKSFFDKLITTPIGDRNASLSQQLYDIDDNQSMSYCVILIISNIIMSSPSSSLSQRQQWWIITTFNNDHFLNVRSPTLTRQQECFQPPFGVNDQKQTENPVIKVTPTKNGNNIHCRCCYCCDSRYDNNNITAP